MEAAPHANKLCFFSLLLFFLVPTESNAAGEKSPKNWTINPTLTLGLIHEFPQYTSFSTGGGVSADYRFGPWFITTGVELEKYVMSYFGIPREGIVGPPEDRSNDSGIVSRLRVSEKKETLGLSIGRRFWMENINLRIGMRRVTFKNDFSSMEIFGPWLGVGLILELWGRPITLGVDGTANLYGDVTNHSEDYVLFSGGETISFYGEPRYDLQWQVLIGFRPRSWLGLSLGYEGSVTYFKYIYRYSNGLRLQAEF